MSYKAANEAREILLQYGYHIREFRCTPGGPGGPDESWPIVLTGPNGDEFSLQVGGPGSGVQELHRAALDAPTCGEYLAALQR